MKSTIKVHEAYGHTFITGSVSIEDFHRKEGEKFNRLEYCGVPERQYECRLNDAPFRNVTAYFRESWSLDPGVIAVLNDCREMLNIFDCCQSIDNLGRVVSHLVDARLKNVKKQETADARVKEANEELDRWIREDLDTVREEKLREVINRIETIKTQVNQRSIEKLSEHTVKSIGDEGDEEIIRLTRELEEAVRHIGRLESRKLERRKELCREWLDKENELPEEFVAEVRQACEDQKQSSPKQIMTLGCVWE